MCCTCNVKFYFVVTAILLIYFLFVCLFLKPITSKVRTTVSTYLHQFDLDILWQSGRLHHIGSRSHHLQQEENDRRMNDTQQVIKGKLPLPISNQLWPVQYGEICMWSDVGFNICWTINSPNSTHIFPCGRLGDLGAVKSWKDNYNTSTTTTTLAWTFSGKMAGFTTFVAGPVTWNKSKMTKEWIQVKVILTVMK